MLLCVYGLSHRAGLAAARTRLPGRGAFLLFFFVMVVATGQIAQELARRSLAPPARGAAHRLQLRCGPPGRAPHRCLGRRPALLDHALQARASPGDGLPPSAGSAGFGGLLMKALEVPACAAGATTAPSPVRVGLLDRIAVLCFAAPVFFHLGALVL